MSKNLEIELYRHVASLEKFQLKNVTIIAPIADLEHTVRVILSQDALLAKIGITVEERDKILADLKPRFYFEEIKEPIIPRFTTPSYVALQKSAVASKSPPTETLEGVAALGHDLELLLLGEGE